MTHVEFRMYIAPTRVLKDKTMLLDYKKEYLRKFGTFPILKLLHFPTNICVRVVRENCQAENYASRANLEHL